MIRLEAPSARYTATKVPGSRTWTTSPPTIAPMPRPKLRSWKLRAKAKRLTLSSSTITPRSAFHVGQAAAWPSPNTNMAGRAVKVLCTVATPATPSPCTIMVTSTTARAPTRSTRAPATGLTGRARTATPPIRSPEIPRGMCRTWCRYMTRNGSVSPLPIEDAKLAASRTRRVPGRRLAGIGQSSRSRADS